MCKQHDFETILTSNDVMNIQDTNGKGLGYRERALYMGMNNYSSPRITIDYYRQTYFFPEKMSHIQGMLEKPGQ